MEATVSAFVDQILQEALRLHATDIHLEPYSDSIRLRYRVDGILETVPVPADMRHLHPAVVSRLKIMAGLNISREAPAARWPHRHEDRRRRIRPARLHCPDQVWRSRCLRILGRQNLFLDLGQLGMEPNQEAVFARSRNCRKAWCC